jgi:hypothetical protein
VPFPEVGEGTRARVSEFSEFNDEAPRLDEDGGRRSREKKEGLLMTQLS